MGFKTYTVALLGDVNIDLLMNIPVYPPLGGDALVYDLVVRTGGTLANTAIVLSRLNLATELITHLGSDPWADIAIETLRAEGVGMKFLQRDIRAGTGLIFIPVTPDGERTMFSYRGANVLVDAGEVTSEMLTGIDLLHLSGYSFMKSPQKDAAWRAIELAESLGIPLTLDLGVEPAVALGADLEHLLGKLDLLVLGDQEAMTIAHRDNLESALDYLLSCGVKTIGLKLGKEGCMLVTSQSRAQLPGFKVNTIDTTGAGDAFSAGMIFGRLCGLSLEARALLANTLGALATTVWGGGASLQAMEFVRIFLSQQKNGSQNWDGWVDEVLLALDVNSNRGSGEL
ncbi:MAG: carbohydrate kinase family protein [Chloroflexi bacterium]|nr:carbohydrate kinase family protein [Chloroflexota bacterium]